MNERFQYVETIAQLQAVVDTCSKASVIAVDTEFARFNTYYPIVGLIQIATIDDCFLIDPLAVVELSSLKVIFQNKDIIKVFHACSEDLEVFQYSFGCVPEPLFDTQVAAAMLGVGFSMSYQRLVQHWLGIDLPKDQTRSDWLARPLSKEQLQYAALDVVHLLHICTLQEEELAATGKRAWLLEESASLGQDIPTMIDPQLAYKKLKGLWQLERRQLNRLRALCAWREEMARKENKPRNRIADQKALMNIVRHNFSDRRSLQQASELSQRQLRKYGDDLLRVMREADEIGDDDLPREIDRDAASLNRATLKRLKKIVNDKAEELSISPELLTKRRHLEKLIRSSEGLGVPQLPEGLLGWRSAAVGGDLIEALAE
ncbi:MAG TPA: ribonuclease D [Gammaproteobacteria bacterium]|nr:ribonuclease D [Gammaproteobacteria bacterium]